MTKKAKPIEEGTINIPEDARIKLYRVSDIEAERKQWQEALGEQKACVTELEKKIKNYTKLIKTIEHVGIDLQRLDGEWNWLVTNVDAERAEEEIKKVREMLKEKAYNLDPDAPDYDVGWMDGWNRLRGNILKIVGEGK